MYFAKYLKSYKQKNIALLAAALIGCIAIYFINIKKTISHYQGYQNKKEQLSRVSNADELITQYQMQLAKFQQKNQKSYDREALLEEVTNFCRANQLLVKTFPQAQRVEQNNYPIITNHIEVEGAYKEIVKLVYLLEYEEKLGSVGSLKFYTKKDRYKKKNFLRANIVLRNLEG